MSEITNEIGDKPVVTKNDLPLNVCKLCNDLLTPLSDGIYIVMKDEYFKGMIWRNHQEVFTQNYSKDTVSLCDIIVDLESNAIKTANMATV